MFGRKQILRKLKLPGILRDIGISLRTVTEAIWEHTLNEETSVFVPVEECVQSRIATLQSPVYNSNTKKRNSKIWDLKN
jgi:hypothetical protein